MIGRIELHVFESCDIYMTKRYYGDGFLESLYCSWRFFLFDWKVPDAE